MRHSDGFKSLVKHGYEVEGVESVPEADSERVFKKLARKHDIVFATSFGYMESLWFVHPQRTRRQSSCTPQDTRVMTQIWIITCVTPFKQDTSQVLQFGMMTKTNKIGVVGSHPIPEIIRNINALTLGGTISQSRH